MMRFARIFSKDGIHSMLPLPDVVTNDSKVSITCMYRVSIYELPKKDLGYCFIVSLIKISI